MRKWFLAACAALLAAPAFAQVEERISPPVPPLPTGDPTRSVCHVRTHYLGGGEYDCGTGTVVACEGKKSLVLTNEHVVRRATGDVGVYCDGHDYKARIVARGTREIDLALLEVDAELPAAPIGDEPAAGDRVTIHGWGPGRPTVRTGVVLSQTSWRFVTPTLAVSLTPVSGDSGSGVFNDRGELVGVIHSAWCDGPGGSAVPVSVTASWTVEVTAGRRMLFPRFRAALANVRGLLAPPVTTRPEALPPATKRPEAIPPAKELPKPVPPAKDIPKAVPPVTALPGCRNGLCPPPVRFYVERGRLFRR